MVEQLHYLLNMQKHFRTELFDFTMVLLLTFTHVMFHVKSISMSLTSTIYITASNN